MGRTPWKNNYSPDVILTAMVDCFNRVALRSHILVAREEISFQHSRFILFSLSEDFDRIFLHVRKWPYVFLLFWRLVTAFEDMLLFSNFGYGTTVRNKTEELWSISFPVVYISYCGNFTFTKLSIGSW